MFLFVASGIGDISLFEHSNTAWLVLQAQQHASLPALSGIMLGYVMPLTVITIVVSIVRSNGKRGGT